MSNRPLARPVAAFLTDVAHVAVLCICCALLVSGVARAQESGSGDGPRGTFFPVDALNEGLPEAPDRVDRSTPQSSVESFLDATELGDFDVAAQMLNLNGLETDQQARRGPQLARELDIILDRRAILSWRALLERPDALNAQQSSNAAMAGQPRRSILLGVLDLGTREAAIRLDRVKPPEGDPVWVFSERTVAKVPGLFALYGPSWLEDALPDRLKRETALGLRVWELIGIPVIFVLAVFTGWMTWRLHHRLARRANREWSTILLEAIRWPSVIVLSTSVILILSLRIFTVSGLAATIITPMTLIGYIAATLMFLLGVIDAALDRMVTLDSEKLADPEQSRLRGFATSMSALRRALIVLALVVSIAIVLASANVFRSLGFSLLASAGAVTLILGFAARQVLGNILASLQIALNRSARIGDQLIFEGTFCTVERIHFTFVQLKTWDGNRLVVPVSHFVSDSFENWSMVDGGMIRTAILTLAQEADIDALRQRFLSIVEEDDRVDPKDRARVLVIGQDAFGQQVRFEFPTPDPSTGWVTSCEIRERIIAAARALEEESGRPVLPKAGIGDMAA